MKTSIICILMLMFIIFCYATGTITSKYTQCPEPTPEQCLSVCIEEFEKWDVK